MKLPFVKSTWESSIKANAFLSLTALILSITSLAAVLNSQSKHERIVLTPMVVDKQMTVEWRNADGEYLKAFGLSVAQLVGDLTPENVTFVLDALSRFMDPSIYADLRKKMLVVTDTRQFKELASSSRYLPSGVVYEHNTGKVFVSGTMETSTTLGKEKHLMTYEMTVRVENGMPVIFSFDNYADSPHTQEWTISHPAAVAAAEKKSEQEVK
jgi:conjugal transfer pilus assembly protein TraE